MLEAGLAIMDAINEQNPVAHPENSEINVCHHVYLEAPGSTAQHSRHAMAIHPGWFDRSPCGTGTSARMAQLTRAGCSPRTPTSSTSPSSAPASSVGSSVRPPWATGPPSPTVTGRAWITGTAQYLLDPSDPFPAGFVL
jgi:proline racemase